MNKPTLYRKRLIPDECVALKDDVILYADETMMITKWNTLKPRQDFHHGYSCYYLKEGFKISRFYREDHSFVYWYCDIVSFSVNEPENTILITDLLADVIIMHDSSVKVLDLDELCEAKEKGLLSSEDFFHSVKLLGNLLNIIETGRFLEFTQKFMEIISDIK